MSYISRAFFIKKAKKSYYTLFTLICCVPVTCYSQSVNKSKVIIYISQSDADSSKVNLENLSSSGKENHKYYRNNKHNLYFLLSDKSELNYYLTRIHNDHDLINKVSRDTFYVVTNDKNYLKTKLEILK